MRSGADGLGDAVIVGRLLFLLFCSVEMRLDLSGQPPRKHPGPIHTKLDW
jgi:hypothetical protein